MIPPRGRVYVKPIQTAESQRGLILLEQTREGMAANQAEIVAVGADEECEDEDCGRFHFCETSSERIAQNVHPIDERIAPGAWVLIRPRSLVPVAPDGERLYSIRVDDVWAVFTESVRPADQSPPTDHDATAGPLDGATPETP